MVSDSALRDVQQTTPNKMMGLWARLKSALTPSSSIKSAKLPDERRPSRSHLPLTSTPRPVCAHGGAGAALLLDVSHYSYPACWHSDTLHGGFWDVYEAHRRPGAGPSTSRDDRHLACNAM